MFDKQLISDNLEYKLTLILTILLPSSFSVSHENIDSFLTILKLSLNSYWVRPFHKDQKCEGVNRSLWSTRIQ